MERLALSSQKTVREKILFSDTLLPNDKKVKEWLLPEHRGYMNLLEKDCAKSNW